MLKRIQYLVILFILSISIPPLIYAGGLDVNIWGGYSYTSGAYIDQIEEEVPVDVNRNQYAAGIEFWGGDFVQFGATLGFNSLYSGEDTVNAAASGDRWIEGGAVSHTFDMNALSFMPSLNARFMFTENFYIGAGTGYQVLLSRPAIDGEFSNRYADDCVIAMAITGYNIAISDGIFISVSFRTVWGFEQENMFVSYIPGLGITFRLD